MEHPTQATQATQANRLTQLNKLICKVFKIEEHEITDELTSQHVDNWDSLSQLGLITSIEETFQITFEMEELFSMGSIGEIRKILDKHLNAKAGA